MAKMVSVLIYSIPHTWTLSSLSTQPRGTTGSGPKVTLAPRPFAAVVLGLALALPGEDGASRSFVPGWTCPHAVAALSTQTVVAGLWSGMCSL